VPLHSNQLIDTQVRQFGACR